MNIHDINDDVVEALLCLLIEKYVEKVLFASKELLNLFGLEELCDWKSAGIPVSGDLKDNHWKYAFHGSGCEVISPEFQVDFEFDINCYVGGFDTWRLWSFICDNENIDADLKLFRDKNILESAFKTVSKSNFICKEINGKQSDLYFLAKVE